MKEIKKNELGLYGVVEDNEIIIPFKYYKIDIIPGYDDLFIVTLNSGVANNKGVFVRNKKVINSTNEELVNVTGGKISFEEDKLVVSYEKDYLNNINKAKIKLTNHKRRLDF